MTKNKKTGYYRNKFEEKAGNILKGWKYEPYTIPYVMYRTYNPDFVKDDIIIEAKGFFRVGDTLKYKSIRDSVEGKYKIVFLLSDPNKKVRKGSKMTMGQWCDKEGFEYYTLDTLEELCR